MVSSVNNSLFFVENLKKLVQNISPALIFKEEKYSGSTIYMISSTFSQIMILERILKKMNKMISYNQVTNHFWVNWFAFLVKKLTHGQWAHCHKIITWHLGCCMDTLSVFILSIVPNGIFCR